MKKVVPPEYLSNSPRCLVLSGKGLGITSVVVGHNEYVFSITIIGLKA